MKNELNNDSSLLQICLILGIFLILLVCIDLPLFKNKITSDFFFFVL